MPSWSKQREVLAVNGVFAGAVFLLLAVVLGAQAPDAYVRGIVTDSQGRTVSGAEITSIQSETGFTQTTRTDSQGEYYFGSLPRGSYSLKVKMDGFRGLEKKGLELAVGARHEENFTLTPISTSEGETSASELFQTIPPTASLPVETLASSVSVVVEESKILQLPLASRNIYSLFLLQPGVTAQWATIGTIGTRGLSFSVHGQRVSGSNYRLDGVDNNNIILTGPVVATSAEAIQEFRMVNSSFSAEYGRATAFVAHVVTRSGGNQFHGSLFEFLANDKLNANTFENNAKGVSRPAFRRNQFGYSVGGPIRKNKTFFSSVLELSRLRYDTAKDFLLPSSSFVPEDPLSRGLLTEIPPLPSVPTTDPNIGFTRYQVPSRIDTWLATERLDHHFANGKDRLVFRYALADTTEESSDDFWGYPSLRPTDRFQAHNILLSWTHSFDASKINDVTLGWSRERIEWPRPHAEIPFLQSFSDGVFLPASYRQTSQRENNNVIQFSDRFLLRRGRSALSAGLEYRRNISNSVSLGLQSDALGGPALLPDGLYAFLDLPGFGQGQPLAFALGVDRFSTDRLSLPDLHRKSRSNDYAVFLQDDIKLTRRLSLNLGLRYEYFGVPHDIDRSKDVNFYFGAGSTISEKLVYGNLRSTDQNPGDLKGLLYRTDHRNVVPSFGIAWDPFGTDRTVVRGGYSLALDRPLDTVRDLRSNTLNVITCSPPECPFVIPFQGLLPQLSPNLLLEQPGDVVQLDEDLVTPYAQNWYLGIQQTVTPSFIVEVGHAGSVGRKLLSRDVINRFVNFVPSVTHKVGEDTYLSNAGNSNYLAWEVSGRRRFSKGVQYQVSYTYSHAIDNQSDIFEGVRTRPAPALPVLATFTRSLDSRVDRGNANFDQRHNLIFNAIWDLPKLTSNESWQRWLFGGWTTSAILAYRTGFPVTVIGSTFDPTTELRNNRVDFLGNSAEQAYLSSRRAVPGGVQWLDPELFGPVVGRVGNLGRGLLRAPGFWNYDFALLREFGSNDRGIRIQFRAEFYNLFNHANLSIPVSVYLNPFTGLINEDFGQAFYGPNQRISRYGALVLENSSRQIQFGVRLLF